MTMMRPLLLLLPPRLCLDPVDEDETMAVAVEMTLVVKLQQQGDVYELP